MQAKKDLMEPTWHLKLRVSWLMLSQQGVIGNPHRAVTAPQADTTSLRFKGDSGIVSLLAKSIDETHCQTGCRHVAMRKTNKLDAATMHRRD